MQSDPEPTGVQLHILVLTAMYPTPERPSWGTFVKQQVESLQQAAVEVEVMAFDGGGSALTYLKAGAVLRRRLRRGGVDLVHAHYGLTGLPALMQRQCPVVLTFHGSDLLGEVDAAGNYTRVGKLKAGLSRLLGSYCAHQIIVAEILRPHLHRRRATTIPMGVDLEAFRPLPQAACREQLNLPAEARIILFVASPSNSVKRFDLAQEAVEILSKTISNVTLLPVFDVPHESIPVYMGAADVLILTSNHEASPCVVKEALACNLPVVSVDVGDVRERIEQIAGCHLVDRSAQKLAAHLASALSRNSPIAGRQAVAEISLSRTAERTIEVYRRVLEAGTRVVGTENSATET